MDRPSGNNRTPTSITQRNQTQPSPNWRNQAHEITFREYLNIVAVGLHQKVENARKIKAVRRNKWRAKKIVRAASKRLPRFIHQSQKAMRHTP